MAIGKIKTALRSPEQTRPWSSPSGAFFDESTVKNYAGLSIQVPSTSTSDATVVYTHPESFIPTPRRNHSPDRNKFADEVPLSGKFVDVGIIIDALSAQQHPCHYSQSNIDPRASSPGEAAAATVKTTPTTTAAAAVGASHSEDKKRPKLKPALSLYSCPAKSTAATKPVHIESLIPTPR